MAIKKSTKNRKKDIAGNALKIGEHLVRVGAVSKADVEDALDEQQSTGDRVGQILQARGKISAYKFYKEYSKFKKLEFINLDEQKCDSTLLEAKSRNDYFSYQYVPFQQVDGVVGIATTDESRNLHSHLDKVFGEEGYEIFITSPYDILWTLQNHFSELDTEQARNLLHNSNPEISSKAIVFSGQGKVLLALLISLLVALLLQQQFFIGFLLVLNVFYFSTLVSKLLFFITGLRAREKINKENNSCPRIDDTELPVYSILVPLYKEKKKTVKKLINSLRAMDYPRSKLDIKLICEIDDFETVEIIKEVKPESNFQIIRVPYSEPRTKPKACNYALNYCVGEFVTIYDAEDVPDPRQLRKTTAVFANSDGKISCIQARLNYFNRNENILTGLFSLEYSSWFDYMLYGLKSLSLPIPLGGTSNHFKVSRLRALYAWDPYNVTEDADLGIRLAFANLQTEVIDSLTEEESPITIKAWMAQRSRWIKGYIQTYFVHMKNPINTFKKLGAFRFFGFTFFVGAPFVVFLTVPVVFLATIISFVFGSGVPSWLYEILEANLYISLAAHLLISLYLIVSNKWYDNILPALIFPFYWLLHYVASFMAVYELIKKPHHWNKTEHGLSVYTNTV